MGAAADEAPLPQTLQKINSFDLSNSLISGFWRHIEYSIINRVFVFVCELLRLHAHTHTLGGYATATG